MKRLDEENPRCAACSHRRGKHRWGSGVCSYVRVPAGLRYEDAIGPDGTAVVIAGCACYCKAYVAPSAPQQ